MMNVHIPQEVLRALRAVVTMGGRANPALDQLRVEIGSDGSVCLTAATPEVLVWVTMLGDIDEPVEESVFTIPLLGYQIPDIAYGAIVGEGATDQEHPGHYPIYFEGNYGEATVSVPYEPVDYPDTSAIEQLYEQGSGDVDMPDIWPVRTMMIAMRCMETMGVEKFTAWSPVGAVRQGYFVEGQMIPGVSVAVYLTPMTDGQG